MPTHEEVGRRVRQARESLGLSQADLAGRLSPPRTRAAVSDIERGKTKLDVEELERLAHLLNTTLAYFYDARESPTILYRRGHRDLSSEQQFETDQALEAFKQRARELAREGKMKPMR